MANQGGGALVFLALGGLWFWLGNPSKDAADWFYKTDAAPWEKVDAFYYPSKFDLSVWHSTKGLKNAEACRDWVYEMAAVRADPGLVRGDYECALGAPYNSNGMEVYRATVK